MKPNQWTISNAYTDYMLNCSLNPEIRNLIFFSFKTHEFVLVYFGLPEPHDRNGNIVNSTCLDTSPLQVLHFFYDEDMEKTVGILLLIRLQGFEIIEKKKKKKHVQRDRDQPESMKGSTEEIFFFFSSLEQNMCYIN